jgi:hypothetical protein
MFVMSKVVFHRFGAGGDACESLIGPIYPISRGNGSYVVSDQLQSSRKFSGGDVGTNRGMKHLSRLSLFKRNATGRRGNPPKDIDVEGRVVAEGDRKNDESAIFASCITMRETSHRFHHDLDAGLLAAYYWREG